MEETIEHEMDNTKEFEVRVEVSREIDGTMRRNIEMDTGVAPGLSMLKNACPRARKVLFS